MSKAFLIVSGFIKDEEKVQGYKEKAGPVMKKYVAEMPPSHFR